MHSTIHRSLACLLLASGALAGQTPAQRSIDLAQGRIDAAPEEVRGHNELALALARRARETADPDFYVQAQEALAESLRLAPGNLEARKILTWTLLGQHEFALALVHARELNRRVPDDVVIYGYLADAHVELGNLTEAEEAVQWMLNLRPGNVPGMTRAAYLRELFGDLEGALDLMLRAYHSIDPTQVEDRAWTLTHAAHLELSRGGLDNAERLLAEAARQFPDYHYAVAQEAELRRAQGRFDEAADLLERHVQLAPHPENYGGLAYALKRAGRTEEAAAAFSIFEEGARAESGNWDNANRELIERLIETERAAEALELARLEISRRQDVRTLDAYAWALNASGEFEEARRQIERALASGIQDARILFHAGVIARNQGESEESDTYLARSLALNPHASVAAEARALLAEGRTATE